MRIISGKFKGHKLVSFDEEHIRPTTDRVKGSLFNIIAGQVDGARVLDLYSGTGSLGLEAFSRGASKIEMVESSRRSIEIIKRNLNLLKIKEGVVIHKDEAIKFLLDYGMEPFDLLLIDPPFPLKICEATLQAASQSKAVGSATLIIIEHSRHEPLNTEIETLRRVDSRDYGDKLLSFYRKEGAGDGDR